MRLLVLSNYYPPHGFGSYERQCYQICQELRSRGHQIEVVTSKPESGFAPLAPQAQVFRDLELYDEAEADAEPSFRRLFAIVRANRKVLTERLARFRPEAVMVWGMARLPTSLLELLETSGVPCLYGVYDFWLGEACRHDYWRNYWNCDGAVDAAVMRPVLQSLHLKRFILNGAALGKVEELPFSHIYFCSQSLKAETSKACGLAFDGAEIIPCAIAPGDVRSRHGPQATRGWHIAYMARLTPEKDPLTAIRAIQELRHRGDERFTLDIFGRGSLQFEASLHAYVRRFQLGGAISFKPTLDEQINNSLHLYDALVFTSRHAEPFPLIHLKAMAARVPVISTLAGGSGELIREGENGLSFEPGNPVQLADQLAQLAESPDLGERLTTTAYANVVQNYTLDRVAARIEALLYRATRSEGAAVGVG
jgi:glycogen synthase